MKKIVTLTVNPTIDKSTRVQEVKSGQKLRCEPPRREPGGGGLNVARAVMRLGGSSTALYAKGGYTGEMLEALLKEEGLTRESIEIEASTRENLIVLEESSGEQFRFGMPGPKFSEGEWRGCLKVIADLDPAPDYLVASGSLAPGMPDDFYGRLAEICADQSTRLVVDTSGPPLRRAVDAGVFLIKPNATELQELIGEELNDRDRQRDAARDLISRGCCKIVVLSLGAEGALVITSEESKHLPSPKVSVRSAVGAGDSMVAGTVLAMARGMSLMDATRFGVAAGAAAVTTEGTELCRREDVETLFEEMRNSS